VYDRYDDPWFTPSYPSVHPQSDLVTHLVFVGGRLAESWSEEAMDSKYADFARLLANERRRVEPPPTPVVPAHVLLLEWLDEQVGGRDSLVALTGAPLTDDGTDVPEADRIADRQRLMAVAELLDGCTSIVLHLEEWGNACRRALSLLWETDREAVTQASSAAQVAAGIVWAVGKANGWFPTSGHSICTQSELRDHFGLTTYPSGYGKSVQTALRAVWPSASRPWGWRRPTTPELDPLGRPDLLTASVRRTLIRLRDQALASERIAAGGELDQAG
jgi:Domain of unknown function (DUF6398)